MKKKLATLCAAAALTCFAAFPAFAAENKTEYKEAAAPIRSELETLRNEMKPLREENKAIAAKYKSIRLEKKNTGTLSISQENWKKINQLRSEIKELRTEKGEDTVKSLRAEAKAAAKGNDFDGALESLDQALELKKSRSVHLKEVNEIWRQIDALLE